MPIPANHATSRETFGGYETRDWPIGNERPPSPDLLSPRIGQRLPIREERRKLIGTLTQGCARGTAVPVLLPSLALGYCLMPFQGCQRSQRPRAPAHSKNVQSPDFRESGNLDSDPGSRATGVTFMCCNDGDSLFGLQALVQGGS